MRAAALAILIVCGGCSIFRSKDENDARAQANVEHELAQARWKCAGRNMLLVKRGHFRHVTCRAAVTPDDQAELQHVLELGPQH